MITKKDFKAAAEIIESNTAMADSDEISLIIASTYMDIRRCFALDFVRYFATQNPRFDRERFMQACGL